MKRALRNAYSMLAALGIEPRATMRGLRGLPAYRRDLRSLKAQAETAESAFDLGPPRPCIGEDSSDSGLARGHYFHQDLLVARRIFENAPERHVDVGSRVDGFVAHVASFRPIEVIDIRPLDIDIPNIKTVQADMMIPVGEELWGYCDSLSCLHALEHFGLGRYGDPVNYDGHLLGLANLRAILKSGGTLYLSVPIGPQRIEFNAHRVFALDYLLRLLEDAFTVRRFAYVDDSGDLHDPARITPAAAAGNFGCSYGCGILELAKA